MILAPAAVGAAVAIGAAGTACGSNAQFGATQNLDAGPMVTAYTVSGLRPSNDAVNAPVAGRLWEATTTVDAVQGTVAPAIPFFNARADNGQNYRVLFQAPAARGLNGSPVPQGTATDGKIYFDVTGAQPTSVVYNDGVQD
ncbi:MAG TPA: MPT63 family protein, partial [Mycobacterium sp.]|nr:MPT63 family protein [Mycobacterium sp.]